LVQVHGPITARYPVVTVKKKTNMHELQTKHKQNIKQITVSFGKWFNFFN